MSINKCIFMGRMAWKDVPRSTKTGGMVIKVTIANQRKKDETNFINMFAFDKTADFIYEHIKVGDQVAIESRLQTRDYTDDKTGQKRKSYDFLIDRIDKFWEKKEA